MFHKQNEEGGIKLFVLRTLRRVTHSLLPYFGSFCVFPLQQTLYARCGGVPLMYLRLLA